MGTVQRRHAKKALLKEEMPIVFDYSKRRGRNRKAEISIETIGRNAFSTCLSLATINLPDSVTTLEDQTFRNCTSLTRIELPSNLTTIGSSAFDNCSSLVEISITVGSFAIFATLFLVFIKWVPCVSIYEVKETLKPLRRTA